MIHESEAGNERDAEESNIKFFEYAWSGQNSVTEWGTSLLFTNLRDIFSYTY